MNKLKHILIGLISFFIILSTGMIISFSNLLDRKLGNDDNVQNDINNLTHLEKLLTDIDKIRLCQAELYLTKYAPDSLEKYYKVQYKNYHNSFFSELNLITLNRDTIKLCYLEYKNRFDSLFRTTYTPTLINFYSSLLPAYFDLEESIKSKMTFSTDNLKNYQNQNNEGYSELKLSFFWGILIYILLFGIIIVSMLFLFIIPMIRTHRDLHNKVINVMSKQSHSTKDNLADTLNDLIDWIEIIETEKADYILQEKKKLQELYSSFCDLFILLDYDLNILYHNKATEVFFNAKEENLIFKNILSLNFDNHNYKKFAAITHSLLEEMKSKKIYNNSAEFSIKNKNFVLDIKAVKKEEPETDKCNPFFIISFYNSLD